MEKLREYPHKIVRNTIVYGAVAGIRIVHAADVYASRHGLFVLRQRGEIMEIANESEFQPYEWKV